MCEILLLEMGERIWLLQLEYGINEVSGAFAIADIHRSLASMIGECMPVVSEASLIYGRDARPLLADVWLLFEGAAMTIIR